MVYLSGRGLTCIAIHCPAARSGRIGDRMYSVSLRNGAATDMGVDPWVERGRPQFCPPYFNFFGSRYCLLFEELLILTVTPCIVFIAAIFTKFSQLILRKIINNKIVIKVFKWRLKVVRMSNKIVLWFDTTGVC